MPALRATPVLLMTIATLAVVSLGLYLSRSSFSLPPLLAEPCNPRPADIHYFGPPLQSAELDHISSGSEWIQLKRKMKPGDTVHQISWYASIGYVVMRDKCFVGTAITGIV